VQAAGLSIVELQVMLRPRGSARSCATAGQLGDALRRLGFVRERRWRDGRSSFRALWRKRQMGAPMGTPIARFAVGGWRCPRLVRGVVGSFHCGRVVGLVVVLESRQRWFDAGLGDRIKRWIAPVGGGQEFFAPAPTPVEGAERSKCR
jgi:hypothetical protein